MITFTAIPFHKLMREAVVALLTAYRQAAGIGLQIYPGRPESILPPTAFREQQPEDQRSNDLLRQRQRTIQSQWLIVWGLFDSAEAAAQRDDFVDGFTALVLDNPHQAHPNTEIHIPPGGVVDIPVWNPDWGSDLQRNTSFYATRITVEGFASG
jgi:hypothetical protein